MFVELLDMLQAANGITELGVIALLATIVWMLVKGQKSMGEKVDTLGSNHMHDIVDRLDKIIEGLQRVEVKIGAELAYLRARLDGRE